LVLVEKKGAGHDELELKSELLESGWLRLPAFECLNRGGVHRVFGGDGPAGDPGDCAERPSHNEPARGTILISGTLTEQRLGLVLRELRAVAAQDYTVDGEVVLVFESSAANFSRQWRSWTRLPRMDRSIIWSNVHG
jgi:hypothetical protein